MRMGMGLGFTSILAATVFMAACGGDSESGSNETTSSRSGALADVSFSESPESSVPRCYPEPEPQKLTIGFASPLDSTEAVHNVGVAMTKEVERLGGQLILVDAAGDPDAQVSGMEQLISRGVDGIVVWPLGDRLLDPVLRQAREKKIPVIGINVNLDSTDPGAGYMSQVWDGIDYAAYLQARAAAMLMPEGAGFGQIKFIQPVPSIEKLVERTAYWAEKYGLEPLGTADNPTDDIAGGETAMVELLGQYPEMQGLIAYNEQSAVGAAAAARGAGKPDMPLIGVNGISVGYAALRGDRIDATVKLRNADVGRCAAFGIYGAAEGAQIPKTVVAPRPVLLNKENLEEVPPDEKVIEQRYGSAE